MSTLSVSSIQNTASPVANIVLNASGSSTLALYNLGVAPVPVQTGTLWYDVSGAGLVIWNGSAWVGVGGGSGTVTGVTGTLPITVATGTTTPVIAINAATTALPGSIQLATAAENAAGTDATKAVTPAFSVPKDASGMTGAGILPSGTTAQRPAAAVSGMVRLNTDTAPQLEQYAGGAWQPIGVITSNLTLNVATTGNDTTGLGTAGAPWATPQRAMAYLSNYQIAQGVTVTVSVADGTYTFTTPLNLNHPNGSQIFINGGTTTGARPTTTLTGGNAVGNTGATLAANDALLNAYYNTKWQFNGCHGLVCTQGGGVTVNTVLIRGNSTSPWSGVIAGNNTASSDFASAGAINLGTTVAVHNFSSSGILTYRGGSIVAPGTTVTNIVGAGVITNLGGSIWAPGVVSANSSGGLVTSSGGSIYADNGRAVYNSINGILTNFGGSVQAASFTSTNNGGSGIATSYGGSINAAGATASNNGANGIVILYGGSILANGATASNNGGNGIITSFGGSIEATSATASNNGNSGIATSNGGSILANSAIALNNTGSGIQVVLGGTVNAQGATATGNGGSADVFCNRSGIIYVLGATYGTISPAVNTVGNLNAATST